MSALAKRFLAGAGLTVFALAVAFALGEIVVRLLYKNETVLYPRYQTDYQYARYTIRGIRPNAEYWMTSVDGSWKMNTNSKGFRNTKDFAYAKPASMLRVLSLGDSNTQGYEVRQDFTFSAVLERFLSHHAKGAEVINSGVSGFSTAEALVFLENEGLRYSPDVVVLGFYANDIDDNLQAGLFGLDTQNALTEEKHEYLPGVRIQNVIYGIRATQWLSENSYFYSLLFNKAWDFVKERLRKQVVAKGAASTAATGGVEYAVPNRKMYSGYQIALAAALIERMHRTCAERGIRFIVVDIPWVAQHYRYNSSLPPELLERLAAARVEIISSQSLLQQFDGVAEMHVPHGHQHISEFTHTLIGIEIGRRLLASGVVAQKK